MNRRSLLTAASYLAGLHLTSERLWSAQEKPISLNLRTQTGEKARLSDLRGKVIVLNFWATWCGPCDVEMPLLVEAATKFQNQSFAVIGVSVDDENSRSKIVEFTRSRHVAYPIWVGANDLDMKKLDLGEAVPATAFLDSRGYICARVLGQMQPGEIEERVVWLLSDKAGNSPPPLVTHLDKTTDAH